jgi:hypothetical protein
MKSKRKLKQTDRGRSKLAANKPEVRSTICLPAGLFAFGHLRARTSHFGNFSSYVRWLIMKDERRSGKGASVI